MPTANAPRINLSYADAVTVLMKAVRITPGGRRALEARVRHLQRLGLPKRSADQKMSRIDYGIVELSALATAFRLMAAFMPPMLAVRYVNERWSQLTTFLLAGAREVLPSSYLARRQIGSSSIAIFGGSALDHLGRQAKKGEVAEPLGEIFVADPFEQDIGALIDGAALVIDSRAFMPILVECATAMTMASDADLASELDRLRFAID